LRASLERKKAVVDLPARFAPEFAVVSLTESFPPARTLPLPTVKALTFRFGFGALAA
jgi:hypothetical protein